jgi:hypothetical protein
MQAISVAAIVTPPGVIDASRKLPSGVALKITGTHPGRRVVVRSYGTAILWHGPGEGHDHGQGDRMATFASDPVQRNAVRRGGTGARRGSGHGREAPIGESARTPCTCTARPSAARCRSEPHAPARAGPSGAPPARTPCTFAARPSAAPCGQNPMHLYSSTFGGAVPVRTPCTCTGRPRQRSAGQNPMHLYSPTRAAPCQSEPHATEQGEARRHGYRARA